MMLVMVFSLTSIVAATVEHEPYDMTDKFEQFGCCTTGLHEICNGELDLGNVELSVENSPEPEDGSEFEESFKFDDTPNIYEQPDNDESDLNESCNYECICEHCEHDCDYNCTICECELEEYIGFEPLTTVDVSTFTELQNAISNSITIVIEVTTEIAMPSAIDIPSGRDITITGGSTLTRNAGSGRHFNVNGTLRLESITLCGVNAQINRGGVLVNSSGRVYMEYGSLITMNRASPFGGGIFNNGTLTINGGEVSNNIGVTGGGISNSGTLIINSGEISNNVSTGVGGGIHNSGSLTINDGEIINNNANSFGGGIRTGGGDSSFVMNNGTIANNNVSNPNTPSVWGGGISLGGFGSLTMNNGTISGNYSNGVGGGIHICTGSSVIMNNGTISGNTATRGGGVILCSGGPYSLNSFTMNGGLISSNTADSDGGGVLANHGTFTMQGGAINGNTASQGAGVYNTASFIMNNGTISGNTASQSGGGVTNYATGNVNMVGGTITGNRANGALTAGGGGLNWTTLTALNNIIIAPEVVFSNNYAASGFRINDQMNLDHNTNDNGRINPNTWTYVSGVANNLHAFNNFDIRTATGVLVPINRTVTFNLHGGVGTFPAQVVPHNTPATAPATEPTRDNNTFAGWYTQAEGGTPFDFTAPITADTIVHARWNPVNRTVTFNLHGGIGTFPAQVVPHNTPATAPVTEPTRDNHTFAGWHTQAEGGTPFDFTAPITVDTVVHAHWEAIEEPPIYEYRYIRVYYMIDNDNVDDIILNPKMANYPSGYTYRVGADFILAGTRAVDRNALPGDNIYIFEGWYVFLSGNYHPTYLAFNRGVLSGSFTVPSSADILSTMSEFDEVDDWANQISLIAVWTIYEAEEITTPTPPTPPTGDGKQQGALPGTGIASDMLLWTALLVLAVIIAVDVATRIARNNKAKATEEI